MDVSKKWRNCKRNERTATINEGTVEEIKKMLKKWRNCWGNERTIDKMKKLSKQMKKLLK